MARTTPAVAQLLQLAIEPPPPVLLAKSMKSKLQNLQKKFQPSLHIYRKGAKIYNFSKSFVSDLHITSVLASCVVRPI